MTRREKISKELRGPDVFISGSDKILAWAEEHAKSIVAVCLVAIVISVGYVSYSFWNQHQENVAAEALYQPEGELKKTEAKIRDQRAEQMKELAALGSKSKTAAQPEAARPVDFAQDYAATVEKIRAQIKNHANTRAALVSALNLASFLIQQKQYPLALEVLDVPRYEPGSKDLLGGFRLMHRGLAYLENAKPDDALKAYQEILKSNSLNYFHSEALLKSGVAYELKGDAAKAREVYEKLGREFPNTEASTTGQQYMRLLDLKSQQG